MVMCGCNCYSKVILNGVVSSFLRKYNLHETFPRTLWCCGNCFIFIRLLSAYLHLIAINGMCYVCLGKSQMF